MTYIPVADRGIPVYHVRYSCGCDSRIASPGVADPAGFYQQIYADRFDVWLAEPCQLHRRIPKR